MAREPVQRLALQGDLRPAAEAVNTQVRAPASNLEQLASSLGQFDGALQEFIGTRDKKADDDSLIKGRQGFLQDKEGQFAKLVDDGKVPAQYNPFYVRGFQQARGESMGNRLDIASQSWFDNWQGKDSDDPNAFGTAFGDFIRSNVPAGTSPDVLRGLQPMIQGLQTKMNTQFIQYQHDKLTHDRAAIGSTNAASGLQRGLDAGSTTPEGPDYPKQFEDFNQHYASMAATGDPGGAGEGTMIDVMAQKIIETHDPKLLGWFDTKVPGKTYTWGETVKGLTTKNQITSNLQTYANQAQARMDKDAKAASKKASDGAEAGIIQDLSKNPFAPVDPAKIKMAQDNGNPTIVVKAEEWRQTLTKGTPSDQQGLLDWQSKVLVGELDPDAAIKEALNHGLFHNWDDLTKANTFIQGFKGTQRDYEHYMSSSQVGSIMTMIAQRTTLKDDILNGITGLTDAGAAAQSDFRNGFARWMMANPDAKPQDIMAQIDKLGKTITDHINPPDIVGQGASYQRPDMGFKNTVTGQEGAGNVEQAVSTATQIKNWEVSNKVTPEQRVLINNAAVQNNMSYEEYVLKQIAQPKKAAPGPTKENAQKLTTAQQQAAAKVPGSPTVPQTAKPSGTQGPGQHTGQYTPPSILDRLGSAASKAGGAVGSAASGFIGSMNSAAARLGQAAGGPLGSAAQTTQDAITSIGRQLSDPTGAFKENAQQTDQSLGKDAGQGMPSSQGTEKFADPAAAIQRSQADFKEGVQSTEKGLGANSKGQADSTGNQGMAGLPRSQWTPGNKNGYRNDSVMTKEPFNTGRFRDLGEGERHPNPISQEQAAQWLDEAMQPTRALGGRTPNGDDISKALKGLIRQGESGNDYNNVNGQPKGKFDLSKMTVDEVLQQQQDARALGRGSSAVGAYQVIYKTLRGIRDDPNSGITGDMKFDKNTQDLIADRLLDGRGFQAFKAGKISKATFALGLSQEWAALENPNTGVSFYDGYNGNKSNVKTAQVFSALGIPASYPRGAGISTMGYAPTERGNIPNFQPTVPEAKPVGGLHWDGRSQAEVKGLTIHHTGGGETPEDIVQTLNERGLGVQFIMGRDGTIYQTAPTGARFAHMKDAQNGSGLKNDNSVGIEIISNGESDITPAQKESAQRWIAEMRTKYPTIGNNVFGHGELNSHKEPDEGMAVVSEFRKRNNIR